MGDEHEVRIMSGRASVLFRPSFFKQSKTAFEVNVPYAVCRRSSKKTLRRQVCKRTVENPRQTLSALAQVLQFGQLFQTSVSERLSPVFVKKTKVLILGLHLATRLRVEPQ